MKRAVSKYLKHKVFKASRSAPFLEASRMVDSFRFYESLVFLERFLFDYEGGGDVYRFSLKDFSKTIDPFLDKQVILRDIRKLEDAISQGESLKKIRRSISYKRLMYNFSQYLQNILESLEIPFSLETRRYKETEYTYFALSDWADAEEIPTELRLHLAQSLIEHNDFKRKEELRVKETLLVLKNTFLPDMDLLDESWSEEQKESMRLSGFLSRYEGDTDDPISKKDFKTYRKDSFIFNAFIRALPENLQGDLREATAKIDELYFTLPSPSGGEPTTLERRVFRNSKGQPIHVYNNFFEKGTCVGAGFGSQIVFGQIISALKTPSLRGISLLAADDGGGESFVGSKVWPKFGYDGQVNVSDLDTFSDEMLDYLHRVRKANADKINVSTILSAVDGAGKNIGVSWWLENSIEFSAQFDLNPNSLSMRVFSSYFRKKLSQFDMKAEEFLSMDLPIDLSSPFCLLQAIKKTKRLGGIYEMLPDVLSTFDSASIEEKEYLLKEIEKHSPLTAKVLKSKRGSSQYTDPTAESVWSEIGQEMIREAEAERSREILAGKRT